MTKNVTLIICVYNRADFIRECLASALAQTHKDLHIIVVDDGSTDGTDKILREIAGIKPVRLHFNGRNLGLMASRNIGASLADPEIIAFMDSDCIAAPNWIEELIKPYDLSKDISMTGGRIDDPSPLNYWGAVMKGAYFIAHKSGYTKKVIGCNMSFRRSFLTENKFDETLKYGGDETDLCFRAIRQGLKIYYQDTAAVIHYHRSRLRNLIRNKFLLGIGNYYVRYKNKVFPFLSIKSIVLMSVLISAILCFGNILRCYIPLSLSILYIARVFYEDRRSGRKDLTETMRTLPGKLLLIFVEDLGYIYGALCFLPHPGYRP